MGRIGDARAVAPLARLLEDRDSTVRRAVAESLRGLGWHPGNDGERALKAVALMEWDKAAALGAPAVPALIGALKDRFATVRRDAVKALGKVADPQAAEPLVQALADKDVRWLAAEALLKIGIPTIPYLMGALKHESVGVREAAAQVLGDVGDRQAEPALLALLKDRVKEVRRAAAEALGRVQGEGAVESLVGTLRDADEKVRVAALEALVRIGAAAVPPLIAALRDDRLREHAVEGLVRLGAPAVPSLVTVLKEGEPDVRWSAAEALGRIRHPDGVVPLIGALKDGRWLMREAAAKALGRVEDSRAAEPLVAALRDPEWLVRKAAADALRGLGWQPMDDRQRALRAVAQLEWERAAGLGAAAVEPLGSALLDADAHVRESAAEALGRSGDAAAVSLLIAALGDKDVRVQRQAAMGLGRLGGDAQAAIEPLSAALGAKDDKLVRAAGDALERIRRATAPA